MIYFTTITLNLLNWEHIYLHVCVKNNFFLCTTKPHFEILAEMVRWTLIQMTPYFPISNTISVMRGCASGYIRWRHAWHVTLAKHQQYQPDSVGLSWYTVLSPWTYEVCIYLPLCLHIWIRHMTCKEHQPCKHDTMVQVNVVWMLARRLRRRPDIKTTLVQRLVFAGK